MGKHQRTMGICHRPKMRLKTRAPPKMARARVSSWFLLGAPSKRGSSFSMRISFQVAFKKGGLPTPRPARLWRLRRHPSSSSSCQGPRFGRVMFRGDQAVWFEASEARWVFFCPWPMLLFATCEEFLFVFLGMCSRRPRDAAELAMRGCKEAGFWGMDRGLFEHFVLGGKTTQGADDGSGHGS